MHKKVQAESATWESHLHSWECEGMSAHIPKWTPTFGVEYLWNPESSKRYFKSQNSLDQIVPYIIGKLLKRRCQNGLS